MIIKQAPLPCDIKGLGVEGVNKISALLQKLETLDVLIIQNSCRSWSDMQSLQTALENITEKAGSVTEEESV